MIVKLVAYILAVLGYSVVAYTLFVFERPTKKIILRVLAVDSIALCAISFSFPLAGVVLLVGHTFILRSLGYKISTAIIANIIVVVLIVIVDYIFNQMPFLSFIIDIDRTQNARYTLIHIANAVFVDVLYFLASYCIKVMIIKRRNWLAAINNSRFQIVGLMFGIGLYLLFFYLVYIADVGAEYEWIIIGIFTVALITYVVILFLMHNASVHAEKATRKEMELVQLATYTENLEYIYTDMRKVRHDFTNVLASMVGFLETRDMDGLIEYFTDNVASFSSQVNQINLNLGLLGNIEQSEIKGLLALKVLKAEELGVLVTVDINEHIFFKDVKTLDLCRMIGILMDNAIEAAIASEQPSICVGLVNKPHAQVIVILNSHKEEISSISKLFEKGYSTKGGGRGFGLSNVREIVNRYQKWSLDTEFNDVMFTQVIELER